MKTSRQLEDPILSSREMADEAGISMATWQRNFRHDPALKIIQMSPRRIGARQSNWRQVLERRAERAGR